MSTTNILAALLFLFIPPISQLARLIVDQPVEWAIGYNADGTQGFMTSNGSSGTVDTTDYSEILRNGGTLVHNHLTSYCPTLSQADVLNAASLNLRQMTAVSRSYGRMTIISVIRTGPKWNLKAISLPAIKAAYAQTSGDICLRWHRTWQLLCPSFGCVLKSEGY